MAMYGYTGKSSTMLLYTIGRGILQMDTAVAWLFVIVILLELALAYLVACVVIQLVDTHNALFRYIAVVARNTERNTTAVVAIAQVLMPARPPSADVNDLLRAAAQSATPTA